MSDAASAAPSPSVVKDLTVADLQSQVNDILKAVATNEPRQVSRVVRKFFTITRKQVNSSALKTIIESNLSHDNDFCNQLLSFVANLPAKMDDDTQKEPITDLSQKMDIVSLQSDAPPEVAIYLGLMVLVSLTDNKLYNEGTVCSTILVKRLLGLNRRTLNPLSARVFFYYSRCFELCDRFVEIRQTLLAAQRISSLHHDDETHATILNALLRNYLHYNLIDQADKLQAQTVLEDSTSSNQVARFRYYQGRIKAIQLDYTGAYSDLQEALRKAPQTSARGFRLIVQKFVCIVQLLMGEIPERSVFSQTGLRVALKPYLQLTQTVRVGDLDAFHTVVKKFGDIFRADKTFTLIQRLRHNVIKTGLRKINISYSRIHLKDICEKLRLDNEEDVEFIVAKAIRDGVIDATIDHEGAFIQSKEITDVYSSQEPLEAFHARINFCLKMHNEAVKAMRYPPEAPKPSVLDPAPEKEDTEDKAEDKNATDQEKDKDKEKKSD